MNIKCFFIKKLFSLFTIIFLFSHFLSINSGAKIEYCYSLESCKIKAKENLEKAKKFKTEDPNKTKQHLYVAKKCVEQAKRFEGLGSRNDSYDQVSVEFVEDSEVVEEILEQGVVYSSTLESEGKTMRLKLDLADEVERKKLNFYQNLTQVLQQQSEINAELLKSNKEIVKYWEKKNKKPGFFVNMWDGFKEKLKKVTTVVLVLTVAGVAFKYVILPLGILKGASEMLTKWISVLSAKIVAQIGHGIGIATWAGLKYAGPILGNSTKSFGKTILDGLKSVGQEAVEGFKKLPYETSFWQYPIVDY